MTVYDLTRQRMAALSSPGLTPGSVANLALWLDAHTITGTADGADLATWVARNATDANATATGTVRPLYIASAFGGHPAVRSDGVNDMMRSVGAAVVAAFTGTDTPNTVLMVLRKNSLVGNQTLWAACRAASATPFMSLRDGAGTAMTLLRRDDAAVLVQPATGLATTNTDPQIQTVVFTGTAATCYKNGTAGTAGIALDVGLMTVDEFVIGGRDSIGTAVEPSSVDIAEVMVFAGALSTANRQLIERAWGAQYGITVA